MTITNSVDAYNHFRGYLRADVEEFWVTGLSSDKKVILTRLLFRGTVDGCLVHPRDVFRFACQTNASSVIVAHNHPSNNAHPSPEDLEFTRRLRTASRLMQIPLIDHLILVGSSYVSFADQGWFRHWQKEMS